MEIKGKIISKENPTSGTSKAGKEWKKQGFVIETADQYPKKIAVEVMGDKVPVLGKFKVGETIECSINIESREYNGRWYTTVSAWKINDSSNQSSAQEPDPFAPDPFAPEEYESMGLPF